MIPQLPLVAALSLVGMSDLNGIEVGLEILDVLFQGIHSFLHILCGHLDH